MFSAQAPPGIDSWRLRRIGAVADQGARPRQGRSGRSTIHVPYNGSAPAVTDLVAGPTSCMSDKLPSSMPPHIKSRALRTIALAPGQTPRPTQADPASTRAEAVDTQLGRCALEAIPACRTSTMPDAASAKLIEAWWQVI